MSARFTYVSPAGTLWRPDGSKMRVVDGGYFENSGAVTAMDVLTALRAVKPSLVPVLILIRNDPQAQPVCRRPGQAMDAISLGSGPAGAGANALVSEVAAPVRALLNARSARGRLAEIAAARQVEAEGGAVVEISLAAVTQAQLGAAKSHAERVAVRQRMIEPPLGWSLSEEVRKEMDRALDGRSGGLGREFNVLKDALSDALSPQDKCHPL
jgi:hypothetical protein